MATQITPIISLFYQTNIEGKLNLTFFTSPPSALRVAKFSLKHFPGKKYLKRWYKGPCLFCRHSFIISIFFSIFFPARKFQLFKYLLRKYFKKKFWSFFKLWTFLMRQGCVQGWRQFLSWAISLGNWHVPLRYAWRKLKTVMNQDGISTQAPLEK